MHDQRYADVRPDVEERPAPSWAVAIQWAFAVTALAVAAVLLAAAR